MIKSCVVCGGEFEARNSRHLTCSEVCSRYLKYERNQQRKADNREKVRRQSRRRYRATRGWPVKDCVICGKEFQATGNRKTCSDACSDRRRSEKQAKWMEGNPHYQLRAEYREYQAAYYDRHREKKCEYQRHYRTLNLEKVSERARRHQSLQVAALRVLKEITNEPLTAEQRRRRKKQIEAQARYQERHPERFRELEARRKKRNRSKQREWQARYRAKRTAALKLIRELEQKGLEALL